MENCRICFTKIKVDDSEAVYKERKGGDVDMLYRACYDCHGRLIRDSVDFGNPEWPKRQKELAKKYTIKVKGPKAKPSKKKAKAKPAAKTKKPAKKTKAHKTTKKKSKR